jgi:hypothetical protein
MLLRDRDLSEYNDDLKTNVIVEDVIIKENECFLDEILDDGHFVKSRAFPMVENVLKRRGIPNKTKLILVGMTIEGDLVWKVDINGIL